MKKKDHWLPQFYLREFAIPGYVERKNAEIWLTNLEQGTCCKEKIKDVARETHFYSFVNADGKLCRRIDDKLTDLEGRASVAYRVLARGGEDLNQAPLMKKLVAYFLATILLRTPSQLQKTIEGHERLRQLFDKAPKSSSGRPLVGYVPQGRLLVPLDTSDYHAWNKDDENTLKEIFSEQIEMLGGPFAEQLFQKRWIILYADQPVFFTGDAPLIKIDEKGAECGINTPGAMLFFPLSPLRMLYMTDREGEMDGFCPFPLDQAELCNVVTRVNSGTFLFSQTELSPECIAAFDDYKS